ncbi:hypothetical protein D3C87_1815410 [compost metagenome]
MQVTLPSSLARASQPSRVRSKNGLFMALGTTAKVKVSWAMAVPPRNIVAIVPSTIAVLVIVVSSKRTGRLSGFCTDEKTPSASLRRPAGPGGDTLRRQPLRIDRRRSTSTAATMIAPTRACCQ